MAQEKTCVHVSDPLQTDGAAVQKKNTIMSSDRNGPIFFFTVSQNLFLIQIWPYTEEEIENILPCN